VVDINRVMPKILLHAKNTSFINYNNGKHLMSGYILWSSIIYLSVLLIMFVVNFINIRNKTIYIKHYCKQPNALFFVIIVLCGIIFSMDIIIGLFLISFGLQFLIKSHLYSIECIREQNNMEILNYEEDEIYDN